MAEYRQRYLDNLLVIILFVHGVSSDPDPCADAYCPKGTVCKLVEVCAPICTVVSVCARPVPTGQTRNPCNELEGTPLIDTSGQEKVCRMGGSPCPGFLRCVADAESGEGRCCPTGGPPTHTATKRGRCPHRPGYGVCFSFCSKDMDCPASQKCCYNGCGNACTDPTHLMVSQAQRRIRQRPHTSSSHTRRPEGTCPPVTAFGECINTCRADEHCDKGRKCCSNGCGRSCQDPVLPPKVGTCPKDFTEGPCMPRDHCKFDSHCSGSDKCCSTSCGRRCRNPNSKPAPRPGVCPASHQDPDAAFTCSVQSDDCQYDVECPGEMKCCKSGCGNKCTNALPRVSSRKRGQCPAPKDNENGEGSSLCISFCSSDGDCPMTQKCCLRSDRCSYMCTNPTGKVNNNNGLSVFLM